MIQFASQDLAGVRNEGYDVLYIYRDEKLLWPGNIIKTDTGFLKYSARNFKQSFPGVLGDPASPVDFSFGYKGTGFGTSFLGPDTARNPILSQTYDEFLKFSTSNIASQFNNYVDKGEYDQELSFNEFNIVSNFTAPAILPISTAYDMPLRYSGAGFGTSFLGPDTARNPIAVPGYDEFMKFSTSNVSSQFNAYVDIGEFDQTININYTNIASEFIAPAILPISTAGDTPLVYKSTGFGTSFLGPDTARNPIPIPEYDEFMKFSTSNVSSQFIVYIPKGEFDTSIKYDYHNIVSTFTAPTNASATSIEDSPLVYKSTGFGTSFLGPDTARNPIAVPDYLEFMNYDEGTIAANFKNPPDTGVKDFDLVYSYSIIPTYFLP